MTGPDEIASPGGLADSKFDSKAKITPVIGESRGRPTSRGGRWMMRVSKKAGSHGSKANKITVTSDASTAVRASVASVDQKIPQASERNSVSSRARTTRATSLHSTPPINTG